MFNPTNPVGQPTSVTRAYPTGQAQTQWNPPAPNQGTQGAYRPDQYGQGAASQGVPLAAIANDYRRPVDYNALRMQNRLQSLGITNTAELLSRASSPAKRSFLVTTIAAMDGNLNSSQVRQYLNQWIGLADLSRTGMQLDTARLLQASGIHDSASLARYWGPMDKLALYGTLTTNAINIGYRLPNYQEFERSVDVAKTLPMAVRW
jgi:hypothetical protein